MQQLEVCCKWWHKTRAAPSGVQQGCEARSSFIQRKRSRSPTLQRRLAFKLTLPSCFLYRHTCKALCRKIRYNPFNSVGRAKARVDIFSFKQWLIEDCGYNFVYWLHRQSWSLFRHRLKSTKVLPSFELWTSSSFGPHLSFLKHTCWWWTTQSGGWISFVRPSSAALILRYATIWALSS